MLGKITWPFVMKPPALILRERPKWPRASAPSYEIPLAGFYTSMPATRPLKSVGSLPESLELMMLVRFVFSYRTKILPGKGNEDVNRFFKASRSVIYDPPDATPVLTRQRCLQP